MMYVNETIKTFLVNSGWDENRKVNKKELIDKISENGYDALPKVIDFLEQFDGIIIRFPNLKNGISDDITLDFDKADELVYPERIHEDYQSRIGKKLCIIGTAYREHYVLIMDEDGMVYGGYDNYLVKIGDSGLDALEAIITNRKSIEIG